MAAFQSTDHEMSIFIRVYDRRALVKAARDKCRVDGVAPGIIRDYRDAARWLLDPGVNPAGMEILDSAFE